MAETYAVVEDGVVTNLAHSEPDFAESQGWIPTPDDENTPSIGWAFDGTTFIAPPDPPITKGRTFFHPFRKATS